MSRHHKITIFSPANKYSLLCARRKNTGFGMAEAFASAIFIVISVIIALDCWFMITAARINDYACRDAARAAAQAGGSQTNGETTALNAAMAAAGAYTNMASSVMVNPPQVAITAYNNTSSWSGTTPPLSVTIQCTCTVKSLVPLSFLGQSGNNVTFTDQKTYPIVPSTVGVQANNIMPPGH